MKLPRLTHSGLLLAMLVSASALQAQTTAVEFNRLGSADRQHGNIDLAIADFTKAIELDPQYAVAYSNRGNAKRLKGDLDGSLADFDKAIELKPDFAGAYNNRGLTKRFKGDYDGAVADFTKAIELDPKHQVGVINLANARKHPFPLTPAERKNLENAAIFARQEQEIRAEVDAMPQPPPRDNVQK